jgi:hypothetical protein
MFDAALQLASEWTGVEAQLEKEGHRELTEEIDELVRSAAAAQDPVAKRQLEMAAEALREELGRLDELTLRKERVLAKLKSQVALLERARVALIGMRSSHAQLKSAELAALSRKFESLSNAQSEEGKVADQAATQAELALHESSPIKTDVH